ncbi:MAG TPA: hypothetical protein VFO16_06065 [Pseudonocardiaceae bacterium]|nr:hypothetical protein [Pseudonocardiaceae bacterium]
MSGSRTSLTRFKTLAFGETPLNAEAALTLLARAGLTDVRSVPTRSEHPG